MKGIILIFLFDTWKLNKFLFRLRECGLNSIGRILFNSNFNWEIIEKNSNCFRPMKVRIIKDIYFFTIIFSITQTRRLLNIFFINASGSSAFSGLARLTLLDIRRLSIIEPYNLAFDPKLLMKLKGVHRGVHQCQVS